MRKIKGLYGAIVLSLLLILSGCVSNDGEEKKKAESGTLNFTTNGEDFIRQGFTTKDGWSLSFDHVYVTLSEITAYQTEPPYQPEVNSEITPKEIVKLEGTYTVDLAEGDPEAEPILVGQVEGVPFGHYNAISWNLIKKPEGEYQGSSIVLVGKATKEAKTMDFTIQLDPEYNFRGGEFIGDERKGIVSQETGASADLEMTFHFDHLFGDAELPANDELNQGALGFEPFASLSKDGQVKANMGELKGTVNPEQYTKLTKIFENLGHVGEGHCYSKKL